MGGENIKVFISTIIGIICAYLFYIFGISDKFAIEIYNDIIGF